MAADESARVFDVGRSFCGRSWRFRQCDVRTAEALSQRFELPEIVGRVLSARGVALDSAEAFLQPTLRRLLPDPHALKDMNRAAERLARAIRAGEPVAVLADYDVDGATSAALLRRFLAAVGLPARLYVPDRLREGYGPNTAAFAALADEGVKLVVTVDCGVNAEGPLRAAADRGLDVIVVDHHQAPISLPPAVAVINPNRRDEDGGLGNLAAVGVAFLLAIAVNRQLRGAGWYEGGRPEPDLRQWLDLVALGTVCDMVPLTGLNRAFVRQGLKVMAARGNLGLTMLADRLRLNGSPKPFHLGYLIGPRINAGGRVGASNLGSRLLASDDPDEVAPLAERLDQLNRERQRIEQAVLAEAMAQVMTQDAAGSLVWACGEGWHPGVIGIIASRLAERFHKPAVVVARNDGIATASGRSLPGIDLGAAVNAALDAGLLLKGGGHAMAAGFSAEADRLEPLLALLSAQIEQQRTASPREDPRLDVDGVLSLGGASPSLHEALAAVGPFGAGNPEPRFAFRGVGVTGVTSMGGRNLRCRLVDPAGPPLEALAFGSDDSPLLKALRGLQGRTCHIAGRLQEGSRGRGVSLLIDDAAATV